MINKRICKKLILIYVVENYIVLAFGNIKQGSVIQKTVKKHSLNSKKLKTRRDIMFCSKCGKENANGSKFCGSCGAVIQQGNIVEPIKKAPLMEVITFTEHPTREQTTIDMHRKLGWTLKNNQEINNSTTHVYGQSYNGTGHVNSYVVKEHYVKLTFERDKNMPNYNILKEKYDEFCRLSKQIEELEASIHNRSGKFYFLCCLPSIIIFLFNVINAVKASQESFFGGVALLSLIPIFIFLGALIIPIMLISDKIVESKEREKISPKVDALYKQMYFVANEAERYL